MWRVRSVLSSYNGLLLQDRPLQVSLLPELCSHRQRHLEGESEVWWDNWLLTCYHISSELVWVKIGTSTQIIGLHQVWEQTSNGFDFFQYIVPE